MSRYQLSTSKEGRSAQSGGSSGQAGGGGRTDSSVGGGVKELSKDQLWWILALLAQAASSSSGQSSCPLGQFSTLLRILGSPYPPSTLFLRTGQPVPEGPGRTTHRKTQISIWVWLLGVTADPLSRAGLPHLGSWGPSPSSLIWCGVWGLQPRPATDPECLQSTSCLSPRDKTGA